MFIVMFRKTVFWTHLVCGLVTAIVVLNLSVTGVILAFEPQIEAWATTPAVNPPTPSSQRLSILELHALGSQQRSLNATEPAGAPQRGRGGQGSTPLTVVIDRDPTKPIAVRTGRRGGTQLDPYTGELVEPRNPWVNEFFSTVLAWHRWFNVSGDGRPFAKFINGTGNLIFLFLAISGLYLWFPRKWIKPVIRTRFVPQMRHAMSRARDYNWHHAMGFWAAIPLVILIVTGSVFSFRWPGDLIYASLGIERPGPPQRAAASPPEGAATSSVSNRGRGRSQGETHRPATSPNPSRQDSVSAEVSDSRNLRRPQASRGNRNANHLDVDALTEKVLKDYPDWRSVSVTVPNQRGSPLIFLVDRGNGSQPQLRTTINVNRRTGETLEVIPFKDLELGLQVRGVIRFLHTGAIIGVAGQTVAGLASLIGVIMVWTGVALAYRRLVAPAINRRRMARTKTQANLTGS